MQIDEILASEVDDPFKFPDTLAHLQDNQFLMNCLMLGGSRYMNQKYPDVISVSEDTDWDYYCQDHDVIREELLKIPGMYLVQPAEQNKVQYPYDDLAIDIYQSLDKKCQVIVRSNVDKYSKVMANINPEFYRDYLWKSGPNKPDRYQIQRIFNQLFQVA